MSTPVHLGIDFGTSHTVAVLRKDDGSTTPLLFEGSPLLPSAVYAGRDGTILTGRDALHSARIDPARFEPHPKRRVDDGSILLGDSEPTVAQVFASVLSRVKEECLRVENHLPAMTLTHPATWGPARRMMLQDAAAEADIPHPRFLPEPVAAATYFAQSNDIPIGSGVVVYDFGGGTFDVSVVIRTASGFEVSAVDGSAELGGVDLDHLLFRHVGRPFDETPEWMRLVAPHTSVDRRHHRNFTEDIRQAKERLSRQMQVDLVVPLLDREIHLTRAELDAVIRPPLDTAARITQSVIRSARLSADRTAGVFLVGGASRMPLVATLLHRAIGIAPTVIDHPELVVAQGATLPESAGDSDRQPEAPPVRQSATISAESQPSSESPPSGQPNPPRLITGSRPDQRAAGQAYTFGAAQHFAAINNHGNLTNLSWSPATGIIAPDWGGGPVVGKPGGGFIHGGFQHVFARTSEDSLRHWFQAGYYAPQLDDWTTEGVVKSNPTGFAYGTQQHVFFRNAQNKLEQRFHDIRTGRTTGRVWSDQTFVGNPFAFVHRFEQHVFARTESGGLAHWYWWPGIDVSVDNWGVTSGVASDITGYSYLGVEHQIFFRNVAGELEHRVSHDCYGTISGSVWPGGPFEGTPHAMVHGDQQHIFGRRKNGDLVHWCWEPGIQAVAIDDWGALGVVTGDPVGLSTSGHHHVFYRTAAGTLGHRYHDDASGGIVTDDWGGSLADPSVHR